MLVNSLPSCYLDSGAISIPLVLPDDNGEYALRYIWMQHRHDNDSFVKNYFTGGNQKGKNVRELTATMKEHWDIHNKIFNDSAENGNLIWRVKVLNQENNSIDYVEVWKDVDTVTSLLEYNPSWDREKMDMLKLGMYDAGFSAQKWLPFPTVSKKWAFDHYKKFKEMANMKQHCIINTPMKKYYD